MTGATWACPAGRLCLSSVLKARSWHSLGPPSCNQPPGSLLTCEVSHPCTSSRDTSDPPQAAPLGADGSAEVEAGWPPCSAMQRASVHWGKGAPVGPQPVPAHLFRHHSRRRPSSFLGMASLLELLGEEAHGATEGEQLLRHLPWQRNLWLCCIFVPHGQVFSILSN